MLLPVTDTSCIAQARQQAKELARRLAFAEEDRERAAIIATELTSNIIKHVGQGDVFVQAFDDGDGVGVELIALDRGPGMADVNRSLQDGYSTAGSAGTGLGAVARLADVFAVHAKPGKGTAVLARIAGKEKPATGFIACGLAVALAGERDCGDAVAVVMDSKVASVVVADGLGHGGMASAAANRAIGIFRQNRLLDPERIIGNMHDALRGTRGAAAASARVDMAKGVIEFCGVGNIVGVFVERGIPRRMVSYDGTMGHVASRIRGLTYRFEAPPLVLLHSDGIRVRWDLNDYPGLSESHPALVAGVLFRDFRRSRDDASIMALKWRPK